MKRRGVKYSGRGVIRGGDEGGRGELHDGEVNSGFFFSRRFTVVKLQVKSFNSPWCV